MARQQFPPPDAVTWKPQGGGLNSDADIKELRGGDLKVSEVNTGALNVRAIGKGTGVSPDYEPILGNTEAYRLELAVSQNKIFRLYIDLTNAGATSDYEFILATGSGNQLVYHSATLVISDIATALSDLTTAINTQLSAYTPVTASTITGDFTGYIEFSFDAVDYFNYNFTYTTLTGDVVSQVRIYREAIDTVMVGNWNLIGSNDDTGDDFEFYTTNTHLETSQDILQVTNPSGAIVQVETATPHGIIENQWVRIEGAQGVPEANGEWSAINVTLTTFDLANATFIGPVYVSGGVVKTYFRALGEIGVSVTNPDDLITYTRLLRSNELNFSTLHQIDCRVKRKQDSRYAVYFTESRGNQTLEEDTTNLPRVFYYKGAYMTDGAIMDVNDENIYDYGNIASELRWVLSNSDFSITWVSQTQTGGAVKSGNWRYAARLLTQDFTASQWSQMTNIVPVFSHNYQSDPRVIGDNPDVVTPKINVLELTNNAQGLFYYVEIAAINYIGSNGFQGYILGRYSLTDDRVQQISHTGNESGLIDLDVGELNQFLPGFIKAQNVELLDSRAILSNLTPAQVIDFGPLIRNIKYQLNKVVLPPIGIWDGNGLQSGEYQLPENVHSNMSHMMFEVYRYGFIIELKSGGLTQVFYPGYDIPIDLPAVLPDERVPGSFTNFDLTDASNPPQEVYSIVIDWLNIDLGILINGVPAYDLIKRIYPVRASLVPQVLGHGAVVLGVNGNFGSQGAPSGGGNWIYGPLAVGAPFAIGPYPFICGGQNITSDIYPSTSIYVDNWAAERTSGFFYCPDISFNQRSIDYVAGDELIVLGAPTRNFQFEYVLTPGAPDFTVRNCYYGEFSGDTGVTTNPTPYIIEDAQKMVLGTGGSVGMYDFPINTPIDGLPHNISLVQAGNLPARPYYHDNCIGLVVSSNITNNGTGTDYGFYRAIYKRPLADPYGDPVTTTYTEILTPYEVDEVRGLIPAGDFVSYGDVFTQKTYLKYQYPGWYDREQPDQNDGYGVGVAYYSQNRSNLQLRCKPTESYNGSGVIQQLNRDAWVIFGYALPGTLGEANMINYVNFRDAQLFYNRGYNPRNQITSQIAFNPNLQYQTDWGNAIAWSDPESDGSNTDNLRVFLAFNLKFLDYTDGSITGAFNLNGELVTVQPLAVIRQYFNTTSAITTTEGAEVVLGSGAVLSRRGTVINNFGSKHKWSLLKGLSGRGQDNLYGWDDVRKTVWRLGYDGTTPLEEIQSMKAFFANNMNWIRNKYTPAHDEGIRGVPNHRYKELIWTVRARKPVPEWTDREEVVQIIDFDTLLGEEMIINGTFQGSINGWEQLGTPPPQMWAHWTGTGPQSAFKSAVFGTNDYLKQINNLNFVVGDNYRIIIEVYSSSGPGANNIGVQFQVPSTPQFTLGMGIHYLNYTAQVGDDNIYINGPATTFVRITQVSIKRVISTSNWLGFPTWLMANNEACADGSDGDNLVQNIAPYINPSASSVQLDFKLADITTGDVTVQIGDAVSPAYTTNGQQTFLAFPTATGVISFIPNNNFDGCVKGNMRLTTTIPKIYYPGDQVQVTGNNFHGLPDIYVCVRETSVSLPTPFNPDWELIPHIDGRYYNEYTVVYNETKNKFQLFMSPLAKIYARFGDGYLVPRPVGVTGIMYRNDSGSPTTWFENDGSVLTGDAYFDATINAPEGRKRFLALSVESDTVPDRVELTTPTGFTYLFDTDFEQREGNEFVAAIKNTVNNVGQNDQDTSIMQGEYGLFRWITFAGNYNKFHSFVSKLYVRDRKTGS